MDICSYHLRCLNNGIKCSECRNQQKDKVNDYLQDALDVWPRGRGSSYSPVLCAEAYDGYS